MLGGSKGEGKRRKEKKPDELDEKQAPAVADLTPQVYQVDGVDRQVGRELQVRRGGQEAEESASREQAEGATKR